MSMFMVLYQYIVHKQFLMLNIISHKMAVLGKIHEEVTPFTHTDLMGL